MAPKTRLAFDARITSIGVKPAKDISAKGKFELGLTIEQPDPPTSPPVPWKFAADHDRSAWRARPEDIRLEAAEYQERVREQERYDNERAEHEQQLAEYQRLAALYRQRVMVYAQVVGIASVFGNQSVTVVLMPSNQDLIPGFAAELTSEASHTLLTAEAEGQPAEPQAEPAVRSPRSAQAR